MKHQKRYLLFSLIGLFLVSVTVQAKIENVLFLISDDLKASTLAPYGDTMVKTPNIDALAAEGMVFKRGYCQGTTCGPSRRSFMHSRYRDDAGITMGENFINNGFVGKNLPFIDDFNSNTYLYFAFF